jgi:hypothetical protein
MEPAHVGLHRTGGRAVVIVPDGVLFGSSNVRPANSERSIVGLTGLLQLANRLATLNDN